MPSSLANAKDFAKSCLYGLNFQAPIRAQSALATEIKYEMRSWLSGKHWRHHFMVMSSVRTPPALKKFPAMGFNYDDVRMGGSTGSLNRKKVPMGGKRKIGLLANLCAFIVLCPSCMVHAW